MFNNYTTKEVLHFAEIVAEDCIRDNCSYDICLSYISNYVLTSAIHAMKKIAKHTLENYKLGVKDMNDVKIVVTMNDILIRAKKELCKNRYRIRSK